MKGISTSAPLRLNGGGPESTTEVPSACISQRGDNVSDHSPLRLTGGGENSNNLEFQAIDIQNSMSEQDIRDVLFEAGYTIEVIDDILAAKAMAGFNSLTDSEISTESEESGSDSVAENAFDKLKEIRIKNVNNVIIGSLNINSLAPKFEQLREIIGKNLDILTIYRKQN